MPRVRLLVGTRKGAFILTSDSDRKRWDVSGPHQGGWEVFHVQASAADPDRLYASLWTSWYGAVIHRSRDGGRTWEAAGNQFPYDGPPTTRKDYSGKQVPHVFKRVWHLESAPDQDADAMIAGADDATLFRTTDGAATWREMPALRLHATNTDWQPGAGGLCLHTILYDPTDSQRMYVAISAAGVFRTDDGGESWRPMNRGLSARYLPEPEPEVGFCVHRIGMHPSRPKTLFMQKHFGVYRSDNLGESWTKISEGLPSDFGFPIAVHSHEPDTIYVVPITSDENHYPPEGKLRVYRSREGGSTWQALSKGLPDRDCYVNVLREAMSTDRLDPCGVYFGTTGGQVYASRDEGDTWEAAATHLPPVLSVEAQTLT